MKYIKLFEDYGNDYYQFDKDVHLLADMLCCIYFIHQKSNNHKIFEIKSEINKGTTNISVMEYNNLVIKSVELNTSIYDKEQLFDNIFLGLNYNTENIMYIINKNPNSYKYFEKWLSKDERENYGYLKNELF